MKLYLRKSILKFKLVKRNKNEYYDYKRHTGLYKK